MIPVGHPNTKFRGDFNVNVEYGDDISAVIVFPWKKLITPVSLIFVIKEMIGEAT